MIRKATAADIDEIESSYRELLTYEQTHGSNTNWVLDLYPVRATAEKALRAGTLYVMRQGDALCASMNLNQDQAPEYRQVDWLYSAADEQVLVVHTLCIPPSQAGRGYGTEMVRFAIEQARQRGCKVIRLDTWAENRPAASLYTKLGFRLAGSAPILLQGVIPEEQIFLELDLEKGN